VNDVGPCACTTVALGPELLAELRSRYTTCLCVNCLVQLAASQKSRPDLSTGRL
jgi:hypothetical protein